MNHIASSLLAVLLTASTAGAAPIVLYETGWEAAPANPAWALGDVFPQNEWLIREDAAGHQVVANGSAAAVVGGQAVAARSGSQFHKFVASSSTTTYTVRAVWPDITAALAALPPTHKIITASLDMFVPSSQHGVEAEFGMVAYHVGSPNPPPWGVLIVPSDRSVNLLTDGNFSEPVTNAFALDTWFNLRMTANYTSGRISVEVDGVNLPSLTQMSTTIGSAALASIRLANLNSDLTAPLERVAFSDNFRLTAESAVPVPALSLTHNPGGHWTLSWSATFSDWIVESTADISPDLAFWGAEPGTPIITGDVTTLTFPDDPPFPFFRLRKP